MALSDREFTQLALKRKKNRALDNLIKKTQENPTDRQKDNGELKQKKLIGTQHKTNRQESFYPEKPKLNPEQTQNKPRTKSEQTQNKPRTNPEQTQNTIRTKSEQSQNKVRTQPRTQPRTKSEQTQNKPRTNSEQMRGVLSLIGIQDRMVKFIYNLCRIKGDRITNPITLSQLAIACETTTESAQVTSRRLMNKGFIRRFNFKNGRGGWTQYELLDDVYRELFNLETQNKLRTNPEQSQNKVSTQPSTQPRTTVPSSSSSNLINKTTTTTTAKEEVTKVPGPWTNIQVPQNLKEVGLGVSHIRQFYEKGVLSSEEVQNSINAFSYDLSTGKVKAKTSPLNFLVGVLLKQKYISEDHLKETQREINIYLEKVKQFEVAREELDKVNKQKQFEKWLGTIPEDDYCKFVKYNKVVTKGSHYEQVMLREYWERDVGGKTENNSGDNGG